MAKRMSWFLVVLLSAFHLSSGENIELLPSDITVDQGSYAIFRCNYSCRVQQTHTLFWLVGDLPVNQRTFLRGRTQNFILKSGLNVELIDESTCERDGGRAIEQLQIDATSAERYNRTAVQCVAYATNPTDPSFYSSYSLMLINVPAAGSPMPSPSLASAAPVCPTAVMLTSVVPSASPISHCPSPVPQALVTVTREVRITVNVLPTTLPMGLDVGDQLDIKQLCNSSASISLSSLTVIFISSYCHFCLNL